MSAEDTFRRDILRNDIELPVRVFFYSLEQIAYIIDVDIEILERDMIYYQGREFATPAGRMIATNFSAADKLPIWRVSEERFLEWLKARGVRFKERAPQVVRRKSRR